VWSCRPRTANDKDGRRSHVQVAIAFSCARCARRPDLIAAWLDNEQLDLKFGLSRPKYEGAGYRLRFVVNSNTQSRGEDILDVRGLRDEEIVSRMRDGYRYAVLESSTATPSGP
jgi:hypothetical protein